MPCNVLALFREVPGRGEVACPLLPKMNRAVADNGHELLVFARALLDVDLHLLCNARSFVTHQRLRLKQRSDLVSRVESVASWPVFHALSALT